MLGSSSLGLLPCQKTMEDFEIPLGRTPASHAKAVFASPAFLNAKIPEAPSEPLTAQEMDWVTSTVAQGQKTSPAPSPAAERYLTTAFRPYDFALPVTETQWRNFVLTKWYQQANDPDPKIAKAALDSIAKSCVANLMVEKKEISITTKPTGELEAELAGLIAKLSGRMNEKVVEGTAERV
jgi:hypothetical protein